MKRVIVKLSMVIDLSESVEELRRDGELLEDDEDIRDFAIDCLQSDLQNLTIRNLKNLATIDISED